jgi:hypothetical protein
MLPLPDVARFYLATPVHDVAGATDGSGAAPYSPALPECRPIEGNRDSPSPGRSPAYDRGEAAVMTVGGKFAV